MKLRIGLGVGADELRGYGWGCAAVSGSLPVSEQDVGGSGVCARGIAPLEG